MGLRKKLADLWCKVTGHTPGFIRTTMHENVDPRGEEYVSFDVEFGCIVCRETLDQEDYDDEEIRRNMEKFGEIN